MALQVPLPGTGKILGYVWQRGLKMYLALLLTLNKRSLPCLLYTSDAADEEDSEVSVCSPGL